MVSVNILKSYIFFKGFTDAQLKKMASIAFGGILSGRDPTV